MADWDAVRKKLLEMDMDQLKAFIQDKGNKRKKDLFDISVFQTRDAEGTGLLAQNLEAQVDLAQEKNGKFMASLQNYESEKAAAKDAVEKSEEDIQLKQKELSKANEDPTPFKEAAEKARQDVDELMIKNINIILEKNSPSDLCKGLEAVVGLLRNVNEANNIDVELFMKDPKKLLTKLKRMESHSLTFKHVSKHKEELEALKPQFEKDEIPEPAEEGQQTYNINPFLPLIEWGLQFATAAEIELRKDTLEKDIKTLETRRADANLKIKRIDMIQTDIGEVNMADHYAGQISKTQERKAIVDEIHNTDVQQANDYQKLLHGFEKKYFEKLTAAVKDAD